MSDTLVAALASIAAQVPAGQQDAFYAVVTLFGILAFYLPACLLSHAAQWLLRRVPPKPRPGRWPGKAINHFEEW